MDDLRSKMGLYRPDANDTLREQVLQMQAYLTQLSQEIWQMQVSQGEILHNMQAQMSQMEQTVRTLQEQMTS